MEIKKFTLQKDGNPPDTCEDASELREDTEAGLLRTAVADGATESFCSAYWAKLLVEAFCLGSFDNDDLDGSLLPLQEKWAEYIGGRELPWYAEEKARRGAFAALVGLTIEPGNSESAPEGANTWKAFALGDSCLFHYRDKTLLYAMPIKKASDFGNDPYLISSRQENNEDLAGRLVIDHGQCFSGDLFLLMTDAVSCWLLQQEEELAHPLEELLQFNDESSFAAWVEEKRKLRLESGRPVLKNDDVTVVCVKIGDRQ